MGAMSEVTHVVYAALDEAPGLVSDWSDERSISRNETVLRSVLKGLASGLLWSMWPCCQA
jgi:hypothetical protein